MCASVVLKGGIGAYTCCVRKTLIVNEPLTNLSSYLGQATCIRELGVLWSRIKGMQCGPGVKHDISVDQEILYRSLKNTYHVCTCICIEIELQQYVYILFVNDLYLGQYDQPETT
jgi:hypothetical protein